MNTANNITDTNTEMRHDIIRTWRLGSFEKTRTRTHMDTRTRHVYYIYLDVTDTNTKHETQYDSDIATQQLFKN